MGFTFLWRQDAVQGGSLKRRHQYSTFTHISRDLSNIVFSKWRQKTAFRLREGNHPVGAILVVVVSGIHLWHPSHLPTTKIDCSPSINKGPARLRPSQTGLDGRRKIPSNAARAIRKIEGGGSECLIDSRYPNPIKLLFSKVPWDETA